jgi:hypothetical protein
MSPHTTIKNACAMSAQTAMSIGGSRGRLFQSFMKVKYLKIRLRFMRVIGTKLGYNKITGGE